MNTKNKGYLSFFSVDADGIVHRCILIKIFLLCLSFTCFNLIVKAQYTINGNAYATSCNCYSLTTDKPDISGSVWNNYKIDLNSSFDFQFNIYLGDHDADGADGVAFTLQPISTSIGSNGGGMGFMGITPSVGVTIDTYQNAVFNDPAFDHIAIQYNGDIAHNASIPVRVSDTSDNVEDGQWHTFRIKWNAVTKTYQAYFDGVLRVSQVNDLIKNIFKNDPMVYWGFSGSTGMSTNLQQFCIALDPGFYFLPDKKQCIGDTVKFYDASISFVPFIKMYWDFGDGSPIDSINLNPVHSFTNSGNFTVQQTIVGADGCQAVEKKIVHIAAKPKALFFMNNACGDSTVRFTDASSVEAGNISEWNWNLNCGMVSKLQNPYRSYPFIAGTDSFAIKLWVKVADGCRSDTSIKFLKIYNSPTASFTRAAEACAYAAVDITDASYINNNSLHSAINNWHWDFGQGQISTQKNMQHYFTLAGNNNITLTVTTAEGCTSLPVTQTINIIAAPVVNFNFRDTCINSIASFKGSADAEDDIRHWKWSFGDGGIGSEKDAAHKYADTGTYRITLTGVASTGCSSLIKDSLITIRTAQISAGKDLHSKSNSPIQLRSTGGDSYSWTPVAGLNNGNIYNPVANLSASQTYYLRGVTAYGCVGFDAVNIKIYDGPELVLPTAFTPNGDNNNDVFKLLTTNIAQLDNFTIYDRYATIVFSTKDLGKGWDGNFMGNPKGVGAYVWVVTGTDYDGNKIEKKGMVVLIR